MAEIALSKNLLFPTQLWTFKNPEADLNNKVRLAILSMAKSEAGVIKSNEGGWQSQDSLFHTEPFSQLRDFIIVCLVDVLKENNYREATQIHLTNGWANINKKNNSNRVHTHGRSDWSIAYYLTDVPQEMGTIFFEDPVAQRFTNGAQGVFIDSPSFENQNTIEFTPYEGQLYIFPSWLPHGVRQNQSEKARISMSANFTISFASS